MWKYFTFEEFACKHCGKNEMDANFIDKLEILRRAFGKPMRVSSGYRCPEHNQDVSTTGPHGPHTTGRAVDIAVVGEDAFKLMEKAFVLGLFTGIGVCQKGVHGGRFIHLDDLETTARPGVWSY